MNSDCDNPELSSGRFLETVRPLRDLESNWTVDLARNLEEYLLKICSGQISGDEDAIFSVNFAEAALLLQGSVQVYSRKVEYLYSLVLHALEFISQKSQEDQAATASPQPGATGVHTAKDEEDDLFWGLDDITVEAKNLLDAATSKDAPPTHFVRPPANLVVLEGECLDAGGDTGELESYLLATNDLYRDFILLDSCDAVAVNNFLDSKTGKGHTNAYRGSSVTSKGRKSFQSPSRQSCGTAQKLSIKKKQDTNLNQSPRLDPAFESNDCNIGCSPPACDFASDRNDGFGMGDEYPEPGQLDDSDDDDDDDPWKPLNPHQPGSLKVKPYKKVKASMKLEVGSRKNLSLAVEFPLAKLRGPISIELTEIWEAKFGGSEELRKSQSPPLYEKLRQSLVMGERNTNDAFDIPENNIEDNGYDSEDPDIGAPDFDMPEDTFNNEDVPPNQEKNEDPDAHANLEDLCRSHLDALLATLAENEKQTEIATRVSTWKQRIELNLEEEDARPPFDIHKYGERVLDKLSTEEDGENNTLSFGDVVKGQEKHDVARTFSALLQLVNNGDIDLVRSSPTMSSTCHSHVNPFYFRLLKNERKKGILLQSSKKRAKSPLAKRYAKSKNSKGKENSSAVSSSPQRSTSSCRFSFNLGKPNKARCTPEGKKRRKSQILAPLDTHFVE
ncbi:hypothetical protein CDL12_15338 [Handroanthus impetiginosus]|uniref:Condensin-2 complex subunit H2 n=1 Tax=Handroanthus impetiginosus TaxID=429701 RepID=A0A2G9H3E5_9LAMI|nr:hypothetical protein CDL12_15338 [Handroanthus impetiginosus]